MFKRTAEASAVMQASLSREYLEGPLFVSDLLSMLASGDFRALPKRDVLYNLHIAFSEGCGVAREENMALGMLIASANEENVLAQYDLALYFASLEDDEQYFKWMLRAACQGDEEAQCNIGDCFTSGRGVVEDTQEGLRWYQKSADQGYPYSIFKIALRLLKSVPEEAFQLLSSNKTLMRQF
jgi:TPR repeat protein